MKYLPNTHSVIMPNQMGRLAGMIVIAFSAVIACGGESTKPIPRARTVSVSGPAALVAGTTGQFTAAVTVDAGGSDAVQWSSNNTGVASVTSSGLVTGVGAGNATITATSVATPSVSGSTSIVVSAAVNIVAIVGATLDMHVGDVSVFVAHARDVNGFVLVDREITWSTDRPAIATVSATGVVTAVALGTAVISATSAGKSASVTLTVSPVPVNTVELTPASLRLDPGKAATLTATIKDIKGAALTGRQIAWSSSDVRVATVSASGLVTAVSAGLATIVATSEGKSAAAAVIVTPISVASVTITVNRLELVLGEAATLVAVARDANGAVLTGRPVTWTSSNPSVASVTSSGAVSSVGGGVAAIQAEIDGRAAAAIVTVLVPIRRSFTNLCMDPSIYSTRGICGSISFQTLNRGSGGTDVSVWIRSEQGSMPWDDSGVVTVVEGFVFTAPNMGVANGPTSTSTEGRVVVLGTGSLASAFFTPYPFFGGTRVWNYGNGGMSGAAIGCRTDLAYFLPPFALVQHCVPRGLDGQIRIDFKMSGAFTANDLNWLQLSLSWFLPSGVLGSTTGCTVPFSPSNTDTAIYCVQGPR